MINSLPLSLIESATKMVIGIRSKNVLPKPNFICGIKYIKHLLESIVDWIKLESSKNPHEFKYMQDEHHDNLTEDEKKSVRGYTYNSTPIHHHINFNMESKNIDIHDDNGSIVHHVNLDNLDAAVNKNKLHHDFITYSGISEEPDFSHGKFRVQPNEYISSSTDPIVAHMFASEHQNNPHHILKIHNVTGQPGLYVGHNKNLTDTPLEFEYIIPRNSVLQIHPEPENIHNDKGDLTHKIWTTHRLG